MIQGTEEWHQQRLGRVTASRVVSIVKGLKGKYLAAREDYIVEKVIERLTNEPTDFYMSPEMQWGTDTEPLARSVYEATKGLLVKEVGFIEHPTIAGLGASPDGLVGDDGAIEIKCPKSKTHLATKLQGIIKRDYIYQMQTVLMCTGRYWCDFVSYDPRFPDKHAIFIKRFERDEEMIAEIQADTISALAEIQSMMEKLAVMV